MKGEKVFHIYAGNGISQKESQITEGQGDSKMMVKKIAIVSTLVLGLVLGLTLPALADEDSTPPEASEVSLKVLKGEVISIDQGKTFFVIQSRGQQEFTITVNSDTEYFTVPFPRRIVNTAELHLEQGQDQIKLRPMAQRGLRLARHNAEVRQWIEERPGLMKRYLRFGEEATFDDITVGAQVVVRAVPEGNNLLAKQVLIIERLVPNQVTGTIASISLADKAITIAPADGGQDITMSYNEETRFILRGTPGLEVGQSVRAIYNEDMVAKIVFVPATPAETTEPAD